MLYHSVLHRSPEQVAAQQIAVDEAATLKAERRRQQEENVRKKAHEKARADAAKEVRILSSIPTCALLILSLSLDILVAVNKGLLVSKAY